MSGCLFGWGTIVIFWMCRMLVLSELLCLDVMVNLQKICCFVFLFVFALIYQILLNIYTAKYTLELSSS